MDISSRGRKRLAEQSLLIAFEGFERDQRRMMTLSERDIPTLALDISGIERIGQDAFCLLIGDMPPS